MSLEMRRGKSKWWYPPFAFAEHLRRGRLELCALQLNLVKYMALGRPGLDKFHADTCGTEDFQFSLKPLNESLRHQLLR